MRPPARPDDIPVRHKIFILFRVTFERRQSLLQRGALTPAVLLGGHQNEKRLRGS
jgi:hypothetical protein